MSGTLLGGIGIGAIVGAVVTGVVAVINANWQRSHDRQMREEDYAHEREASEADHRHERELRQLDHDHDLALRRMEDQQRLRDTRLAALKEGLISAVSAALDLERMAHVLPFRDEASREQMGVLFQSSNQAFLGARAGLLLDSAGEPIVRALTDISRRIQIYQSMLESHKTLVAAAQHGSSGPEVVVEHAELMDEHYKEVIVKVQDLIEQSRATIEGLAAADTGAQTGKPDG